MEAVGELIRAQKMRIEITPTVSYSANAPCLLAQLAEEVSVGLERVGVSTVPGSRPLLAVDAFDLWVWITHDTHAWAEHMDISRRDPGDRHQTPWVGRLLRSCAATAISTGHEEIADRIATNAQTWAKQITALLTGEVEQRGIRGATCPECTQIRPYPHGTIGPWAGPQPTMWVDDVREEYESRRVRRQRYQVPAIVLVTQDIGGGKLRWLTCLACGWNETLADDTHAVVHVSESLDSTLVGAA